jgi:hypothetical protein
MIKSIANQNGEVQLDRTECGTGYCVAYMVNRRLGVKVFDTLAEAEDFFQKTAERLDGGE